MQSKICTACLKSDILCSSCQGKIGSGEVSKTELGIAKFLSTLEGRIRSLEGARIIKVLDGAAIIIIAANGDAAKIVGRQGAVVKLLARHFGKPIRVVEAGNVKDFINSLIMPASATVNTAYVRGGECYRIKIPKSQKGRIAVGVELVKPAVEEAFGKPVEILFE